jgi:hypothetical protein
MTFAGLARSTSSIITWNVKPILFEGDAQARLVCELCQDIAALICEPIPLP